MLRSVILAMTTLLCVAAGAQQLAPITGQWTIDASAKTDAIALTIQRRSAGSNMSSSSRVAVSQMRGLTPAQLTSAGETVRFELARDAGTFLCDGRVSNGGGGGTFTFTPRAGFAADMRSLGYAALSTETVFHMAVHDVSTSYVRELQALGVRPDTSEQLLSMRIHGVSAEYVRAMREEGYTNLRPDDLVTMRIHGVTPAYIERLRSRGMRDLSVDQLVSLRIHGIVE